MTEQSNLIGSPPLRRLVCTVEKSSIGAETGSISPISIGLALFLAELVGVFYTGGAVNPARAFGPDVVLGKFDGYHWIYWYVTARSALRCDFGIDRYSARRLGPALGATVAVVFWRAIQWIHFELGPRASVSS